MIEETINKLEERVRAMPGVAEAKREELATLVTKLKAEVDALSKTSVGSAERIARFADLSAIEASCKADDASARAKDLSIEGLSASVDGFEASHPRLVSIVNQICNTLANLGI